MKDTGTKIVKTGSVTLEITTLEVLSGEEIDAIMAASAEIVKLNEQIIAKIEEIGKRVGLPLEYDDHGFPAFDLTDGRDERGHIVVMRDGLMVEDYADGWTGIENEAELVDDWKNNPPVKLYDICRVCGQPQRTHTADCEHRPTISGRYNIQYAGQNGYEAYTITYPDGTVTLARGSRTFSENLAKEQAHRHGKRRSKRSKVEDNNGFGVLADIFPALADED